MKKIILFVLTSVLLLSCKSGKRPAENSMVDLYPNIQKITKDYYKYSINNAFHSDYFLYSPIEPSNINKNQPRILISSRIHHGNYYYYYYEFIKNRMNGSYTCYLTEGNTVKYRNHIKYYQDGETKMSLQDIDNYFKQAKISYKLVKKIDKGYYTFLLDKNNQKEPAFCAISIDSVKVETFLLYNAKDTIQSLERQSMRPYIGMDLEN